VADSLQELHEFAERAGIKRCWFDKNHYDLNPKNYEFALANGAQLVESRIVASKRKVLRDEASKRNRP
jgi:FMN phosphatase YigB (HAD superfamily)